MLFNKIGFIGLGLIGGSIAKKIKQNNPAVSICATAGHIETITEAYRTGIIDNDTLLETKDFYDCDLIFLCCPVERNISLLKELKDIIKPGCYITDVGSTKGEIHKEVIRLGMESQFIGGHPMTGSEKTGITNANEYLLENAYYIITPTEATPSDDIEMFYSFVKELGSIPLVLDYEEHDYATASISHLPHMIAFSLVNLVKKVDSEEETMKTIAAGGFKDITRIASSSPIMWQNICSSNREKVLELMDLYMEQLQALRKDIADNNERGLLDYFQSAKDYRDSISVPGVKSNVTCYELYLDLVDEAGGIATISSMLAFKGINIKNIGIIHNREFEEGVLRIELYDSEALTLAKELLINRNYKVYER